MPYPKFQGSDYILPSLSVQREDVANATRKRDAPSTGSTNLILFESQKEDRIDAIFNGRPIELTAPPIEIYHPVFAKFRRETSGPIHKASFTPDELESAFELVICSLAFYDDVYDRIRAIENHLMALVDTEVVRVNYIRRDNGDIFAPAGSILVPCEKLGDHDAVTAFTEIKNGIGEGAADPIHQAQCDYVLYYCDKAVRHSSS